MTASKWPCTDFFAGDGRIKTVNIALSPIRIFRGKDGALLVSWACSHAKTCRNEFCRYGHKEEDNMEIEERDRRFRY